MKNRIVKKVLRIIFLVFVGVLLSALSISCGRKRNCHYPL